MIKKSNNVPMNIWRDRQELRVGAGEEHVFAERDQVAEWSFRVNRKAIDHEMALRRQLIKIAVSQNFARPFLSFFIIYF